MAKTILVFGGNTKLGALVSRSYGSKGYNVVLIGNQAEPLHNLAADLDKEHICARTFFGDLSVPEYAADMVRSIRTSVSSIDAIFYGPSQPQVHIPASAMTLDSMQQSFDLIFLSLVAIVGEVLLEMRARKSGSILVASNSSDTVGVPYLSGPSPAMAAARNYLQSLQGELSADGIHVGFLNGLKLS